MISKIVGGLEIKIGDKLEILGRTFVLDIDYSLAGDFALWMDENSSMRIYATPNFEIKGVPIQIDYDSYKAVGERQRAKRAGVSLRLSTSGASCQSGAACRGQTDTIPAPTTGVTLSANEVSRLRAATCRRSRWSELGSYNIALGCYEGDIKDYDHYKQIVKNEVEKIMKAILNSPKCECFKYNIEHEKIKIEGWGFSICSYCGRIFNEKMIEYLNKI